MLADRGVLGSEILGTFAGLARGPYAICEGFADSRKLNYSGKYKRLGEAVLVTHTCDEDPDLMERGGLLGSEVQGAYHC